MPCSTMKQAETSEGCAVGELIKLDDRWTGNTKAGETNEGGTRFNEVG